MRKRPNQPAVIYVLRRYPQLSQTFVHNEIQALQESGVDVRVISVREAEGDGPGTSPQVPVQGLPTCSWTSTALDVAWWATRHPIRLVSYLIAARAMEGLPRSLMLRQLAPAARRMAELDVVACHSHFAWEGLAPAVLLGKLLDAPSSVTVHARDIYVPAPAAASQLAQLDKLATVCDYNVNHLRESKLWAGAAAVVPCGVAVPPQGSRGDVHRIACVGRLVEKKGILSLVAAMPAVLEAVPDAHLDIVGDGPQREEIEEAVAEANLGRAVRLLGPRDHADSLAVIESAGTFALACQADRDGDTDALPVAIREAMVRSRAVVTTEIAGVPEVVENGRTGWVVPPGDVPALSEALIEALTHEEEARRRGAAARDSVLASGTLEATRTGMLAFFGLPA